VAGLPAVEESTIFGFRCIRVDDQFVGMPAHDSLWRASAIVDSGVGEICAPAERTFREWIGIRTLDEALWLDLLRESIDIAHP
jgi:hypothetical protein